GNGEFAEVENPGRQSSIGVGFAKHLVHVLWAAGAAAGHDWDGHRVGDQAREPQLVSLVSAVGVDAVDHQLAGAQGYAPVRPLQRVHACSIPAAVGDDLIEL